MSKKISALYHRQHARREDYSDSEEASGGGTTSGFASGSGSRARNVSGSVYGSGSRSQHSLKLS